MSFTSVEYVVFFLIILGGVALISGNLPKKLLILAGSYVFYAWWDPRFTLLLATSTLVNWYAGRAISRAMGRRRSGLLAAAVVFDVGLLAFFKYLGFFVESANSLLALAGMRFTAIEVVLPIAISFITFEVISYVVDVYKHDVEPVPLLDFSLLIAFFPHLVAGPILKPREFLPQLARPIRPTSDDLGAGLQQFLLGACLKVLVADRLALFVDPVMNAPEKWSSATLWLALFGYALQIYADFAGYSAMAIGSARMLGLRIPENFLAPYFSASITEFWRRWHISLSTWLRQYLYIPLGGNRKGKARQLASLTLTMLVGGLWHGAAWHFVLWGGMHGLALSAHKVWLDARVKRGAAEGNKLLNALAEAAAMMVTFLFVAFAWAYFRLPTAAAATGYLRLMFAPGRLAQPWLPPSLAVCAAAVLAYDLLVGRRPVKPQLRLVSFAGGAALASAFIALAVLAPTQATPFIYFQF